MGRVSEVSQLILWFKDSQRLQNPRSKMVSGWSGHPAQRR